MKSGSFIAVLLILATPVVASDRIFEAAASYVWLQPSADATLRAGNPLEDFELTLPSETGYGVSAILFLGRRLGVEVSAAQIESSLRLSASDDDPRPQPRRTNIVPVTAALQYHFAPQAMIDPYLGVGAMYVMLSEPKGGPATGLAVDEVEADDYGYLVSAGLSIELSEALGVIIDAKYVPSAIAARAVVNTPAGTATNLEMNPIMVSVGVSYRFGR